MSFNAHMHIHVCVPCSSLALMTGIAVRIWNLNHENFLLDSWEATLKNFVYKLAKISVVLIYHVALVLSSMDMCYAHVESWYTLYIYLLSTVRTLHHQLL